MELFSGSKPSMNPTRSGGMLRLRSTGPTVFQWWRCLCGTKVVFAVSSTVFASAGGHRGQHSWRPCKHINQHALAHASTFTLKHHCWDADLTTVCVNSCLIELLWFSVLKLGSSWPLQSGVTMAVGARKGRGSDCYQHLPTELLCLKTSPCVFIFQWHE